MLEQYAAYIEDGDMQRLENDLRSILLFDRSTRKNNIWATDDHESYGEGYHATSEIKPELRRSLCCREISTEAFAGIVKNT